MATRSVEIEICPQRIHTHTHTLRQIMASRQSDEKQVFSLIETRIRGQL